VTLLSKPSTPKTHLLRAVVLVGACLTGSAALACPDWSQTGAQLNYTSDQLWVPQTHSVVAGGSDNLSTCPQPGVGYVATRPDFDLAFSGNGVMRDLEVRVNATCDSVLLVNDAAGQWYFDDDGGEGFNSALRIPNAPEGAYDIWVGTYDSPTCQATVTFETFNSSGTNGTGVVPPATAACPNPGLNGHMIAYEGATLYTPQEHSVIAGGNIALGACDTVPGHGQIIEGPDFTMTLTANPDMYDLEFRTQGPGCDTVLLVNDANGEWHYNDDDDGLTSRLRIPTAAPGEYDVWVGTFGAQTCATTMIAETFGGVVMQAPQPAMPAMLAMGSALTGYRDQVGQTLSFEVTGEASGTVWGSGIYTDDSAVGRAAVHAGVLQVGQTGVVDVVILPGQQSYQGSDANGVTSSDYGSWIGSYSFVSAPAQVAPTQTAPTQAAPTQTAPADPATGGGASK